jgi:Tol biopolymer transport system component
VGFGLYKFFNRPPIEFQAGKISRITATGRAKLAAVSPDGKYLAHVQLAHVQEDDGGQSLWVRQTATDGNVQIVPPAKTNYLSLEFSSDGNYVYYALQDFSLNQISALGGAAKQLFDGANKSSAVKFSPDGKQIAFIYYKDKKQSGIIIIPFDGGEPVKMFDLKRQVVEGGKSPLQWTPDGRAINYLVLDNGVSNIWRQPIDGGASAQVTNFTTDQIFNFAFSPDGSQLALSRGAFNSDVVLIENAK